MKLIIDKEENFIPANEYFLDSTSPDGKLAVVFEINQETAYFYALELKKGFFHKSEKIVDACHIYNTDSLKDGNISSKIKIDWSENNQYALLFINDYVHAIFDFKNKQGYCRTGFPQLKNQKSGWSKNDKTLNDSLLNIFKE